VDAEKRKMKKIPQSIMEVHRDKKMEAYVLSIPLIHGHEINAENFRV